MPFGQIHEGNEGGNHTELWIKGIPCSGNSCGTGLEVEPHLPARNCSGAREAVDD